MLLSGCSWGLPGRAEGATGRTFPCSRSVVVFEGHGLDTSCDAECRSQEGMFTFACATDPLAGEVACLCAGVGDACDAQLPTKRCTGQDLGLSTGSITTGSIVSCEEGAWVESSCAEECDNPDAFCIDGADDATCVC